MARKAKNEVKKNYSDLDTMLGNGVTLDCFPDEKQRVIYPIALKDFSDFMSHIAIINFEALWTNFLQEDSSEAINKVLEMSFKGEKLDELMSVINAQNYPKIIKKIISLNGIEIDNNKSEDDDNKKKE